MLKNRFRNQGNDFNLQFNSKFFAKASSVMSPSSAPHIIKEFLQVFNCKFSSWKLSPYSVVQKSILYIPFQPKSQEIEEDPHFERRKGTIIL